MFVRGVCSVFCIVLNCERVLVFELAIATSGTILEHILTGWQAGPKKKKIGQVWRTGKERRIDKEND